MMFYEMMYTVLLIWLSWEDLKNLHIPVVGLFGLACITFLETINNSHSIWIFLLIVFSVQISLRFLNNLAQHLLKTPIIGNGDIWLMSILMPVIEVGHIPIFLFLIGVLSFGFGIYSIRGRKHCRFALVPFISSAFIIIRIFL